MWGAMISKKAKSKTTAKKAAKRKTKSSAKGKKELNPAKVGKNIARIVESHANKMAEAVIGEAEKGSRRR